MLLLLKPVLPPLTVATVPAAHGTVLKVTESDENNWQCSLDDDDNEKSLSIYFPFAKLLSFTSR